jgi:predicted ester cyclase
MYRSCVEDLARFIEDITYRIWNGPRRDPGLCETYYGPDAVIHTDGGDVVGGRAVTANTRARLVAFPDFHGVIDDTIWTGSAERGFRTSMRWTWSGVHRGPHVFGPATGRRVRCGAIADCIVRDGVIVEEWLAVDPLSLAHQLGLGDADAARLRPTPPVSTMAPGPGRPTDDGPARWVASVLEAGVGGEDVGAAHADPRDAAALRGWAALLDRPTARIDDGFHQDGPDGVARVATRWTVAGPGGAVVTASSHHHVRDGRILAAWTHSDGIAVLARAGALP